jgi:hypothetical protein
MLRVRALGPCTIGGFHTLRSGEVCDVPAERRDQVERLRLVGRVELLELPAQAAVAVSAEPSGNEAQAAADNSSPAPAALDSDEAELAALEAQLAAELAALPASASSAEPAKPKRPLLLCAHCEKPFQEHVKGKPPADAKGCAGMKALFKPAKKS